MTTETTSTRKMPLPTLSAMVVGSMVGAGVFSLPGTSVPPPAVSAR